MEGNTDLSDLMRYPVLKARFDPTGFAEVRWEEVERY